MPIFLVFPPLGDAAQIAKTNAYHLNPNLALREIKRSIGEPQHRSPAHQAPQTTRRGLPDYPTTHTLPVPVGVYAVIRLLHDFPEWR